MNKTLMTPLTKGQLPQAQRNIPTRNQKSYAYQDENGRYFLGTFSARDIPRHNTDQFYVLSSEDVARPDLLSYKFYGTPKLYWVILWLNNISDPFEGMYPGMLLRIPTYTRLAQYGIR